MFGRTKTVLVLGAGPAGLLAAHAARSRGYRVHVFSAPDLTGHPQKSELYGCQYLHEPIPGYDAERRWVNYTLNGGVHGYRTKVYGPHYEGRVSPDEYGPEKPHAAYDLRSVYDRLWEDWYAHITPLDLSPVNARGVFEEKGVYVLNTIPAPALCRDMENHKFPSQEIWAMGSGNPMHAQLRALPYVAPDDTVQCNGHDSPRWYRAATVFGYSTLEWPGGVKPPITGVVRVSKPLSTDCGCWTGKHRARLGRFGRWQKGVLVHTAYFETLSLLS